MQITEFKERKNVHQTHFEDLVLLGQDGLAELNDKIEKFIKELSGEQAQLNTTTKIDGAPAVICWSSFPGYPDNSICLKSFISGAKNALSSKEDIMAKYGDRPDMAQKLLYCLQLVQSIPAGEAWQGDCLYSKNDLKEREIGGTNYLTFHPNKIIYAFSEDNPTYETIKNSDFGICFHTIYKAAGEGKKTQSFRVDAQRLTDVPSNIYVMSPALNKSTNKADYNMTEVEKQFDELKQLEQQLLSNSDYEDLCDNSVFMGYWNTFENANLSDKRAVNINVDTFFDELVNYIRDKQEKEYNKKLSTLKTDAGKQKAHDKYEADVIELEDILTSNREVLTLLVKTLNTAANIKMNLWNGFKKSKQGYDTFYKSKSQGYIPADMEGVAMSDQDGNIVKIVDRSTFSFANRSDDIESGFEHESLEEAIIEEQAMTQSEAIDKCYDLGQQFVEHFKKILSDNDNLTIKHHASEMQAWVDRVNKIKLTNNDKYLSTDKKVNWFLTEGSDAEGLFDEGEKADKYNDFIDELVKHWNVLKALEAVDLFHLGESLEPAWVKNTVNTVQNTDKDPNVIATKEYHKMKVKKTKKGQMVTATPGLAGAVGESLEEDTKKKADGKWVNKGDDGEHGEFKTKKEADAQRKAMFANGYHEELDEAVGKTAVVAFGRMNPPTLGHRKLIEAMAKAAADNHGHAMLYLSHSQDSKKNPLDYETKYNYVKKAFGKYVDVVHSNARTVIQALEELYNQGYTKVIYVGGEDRIGGDEDVTATLQKYNGVPDKSGKVNYAFDSIDFVNAGGRSANSKDLLETISASMARDLVRQGDTKNFCRIVPFNSADAYDLYLDMKAGMGINEELIDEASTLSKSKYTPEVQKELNYKLKDIDPELEAPDPNKSLDDYRSTPDEYKGLFVKQGSAPVVSFSKSDIVNKFDVNVLNAVDDLTVDIKGKDYELYNSGDKIGSKKGAISGAVATYYQEAIDALLLVNAIKADNIIDYLTHSDPEAGTGVFEYITPYPGLNMASFKASWPNFIHDWRKNFVAMTNNEDFISAANSVLNGDIRKSIILHTGINNEYQGLAKQILSGNDKLDKSDVYYYLAKYKKYIEKDISTLVSLKNKPKDYVEYIQSISDRLIGVSLKKVDAPKAQIDFDIPEKDSNYFTGKFKLIGSQRSYHLVFETSENGEERLDIRPAGGKSIKMEFRQKGKAANGSAAGPIKTILGDEVFNNIRILASKGNFQDATAYLAKVLCGKEVMLDKTYKLNKKGLADITAIFNLASGFAATDVEGNRITAPYIKVH